MQFSPSEADIVTEEITKLLKKGVIEQTDPAEGDFISTIYVHPKKDGIFRIILNLKNLSEFVLYYHFNPFAPEPPVTAHADPGPFYPL